MSVILGRGTRYLGLAGLGFALPIPGAWIALVSVVALGFGVRSARKMNRATPAGSALPHSAVAEEA
jgi:hypothetical protein